jgi:DNA replication initiation complex subunit (GINS family)
MEGVSTVARLKQLVDLEEAADELRSIPAETYVNLSAYAQKLRATAGEDDFSGRIAKKQLWLIEVMARRLLELRVSKATSEGQSEDDGRPRVFAQGLLPEERYIAGLRQQLVATEDRFVKAVVDGQPSFFSLVQRRESQRMATVRMLKRVGEIMGTDLKRYGPFEVSDVARLPLGNAQVMVASKQAVLIPGDDF